VGSRGEVAAVQGEGLPEVDDAGYVVVLVDDLVDLILLRRGEGERGFLGDVDHRVGVDEVDVGTNDHLVLDIDRHAVVEAGRVRGLAAGAGPRVRCVRRLAECSISGSVRLPTWA
jgi:hypothetical protein